MIYICNFAEYGAPNAPSIREFINEKPYENNQKIIDFLNNNGAVGIVSTDYPKDLLTGERIKGELYTKKIDGFSWWSNLPYHIEKYNLRLPEDFENYILNRPQQ